MQSLTYVEIDIDYCTHTYGSAPCTASIPTTGDRKCFNTPATCQDRVNFGSSTETMRFSMSSTAYNPKSIDAIPAIVSVNQNPGSISLGGNLGERASVTIQFKDFRHSDTGPGGDKYLADRSYDPFKLGTFFGKFRSRNKYLRGRGLRLIRGELGQGIGDMRTRHYIIDSFSGPDANGMFSIVAKDVLKLADSDRSKAPFVSEGRLSADITNSATSLALNPAGIGSEYPTSGYVAIAGKEVVQFNRKPSQDSFTKLMLHMNGANAGTTFTDSSAAPHTVTRNGNAQTSTAQLVFGTASLLLDGTDDYLSLDGSSDFAFGTGDFTVDLRFRLSAVGAQRVLYDSRPASTNGLYPTILVNASNKVIFHTNSADRITGTTTIAVNTWYHCVVARASGVTKLFINGTQEGSSYTDTNNYLNGTSRPTIGTNGHTVANDEVNGHIDELEVSKGVARWSENFTSTLIETSTTSGNTLAIVRGQLGTTAQANKQDDRVQLVLRYVSQDPADIVYDLLVNYANIDSSYIDLPAWKTETSTYLNRLYTANIAEPIGVETLVGELIEQAALVVWWDDINQEIRLQVLRSIPATAETYDDDNIMENSLEIQEQPNKRISQCWVYYDQRNPCESMSEDNFKSIAVTVDLQRETDYGSPAIKKILSRWIPNGARSTALRINDVQLARFKDPPRMIEFSLFRGTDISLGGGYKVSSWAIQNDTGERDPASIQVTRLVESDEFTRIAAEEIIFDIPVDDLNNRTIILDTSQNNVNIQTLHDSIYPVITTVGLITLTVIIDTGAIIGSSSTSLPAMDIGTFTSGLPITVQVKGRLQGAGGAGGNGSSQLGTSTPGLPGGTALYTRQAITLDVSSGAGEVWGGGGGGGGGRRNGTGGAGTEGGGGGGEIIAVGTPEDVAKVKNSYTGKYLAPLLK